MPRRKFCSNRLLAYPHHVLLFSQGIWGNEHGTLERVLNLESEDLVQILPENL